MRNPITINSAYRIGAMGKDKSKLERGKISCPFDHERHGIILGEGAGFMLIESEESALKRNAWVYGEIVSYGMTSDGYHIIQPSGEGSLRCMRDTI